MATAVVAMAAAPAHARVKWDKLETGLEFARIKAPVKAKDLDSMLTILRIDPKRYELRLLMANFNDDKARSARQWASDFGLLAVINAGLYLRDNVTSVGYMVDRGKVNNPRLNRWGAVLAFNPKDPRAKGQKTVRIVDRRCENFDRAKKRYQTFVQSFRMITCRGRTTFKKSDKRTSIAAMATDRRGRVLFLISTSPYSTFEFSLIIRRLRLGIRRAMYLEGGRDAQLYVKAGGVEREIVGKCGRFFGCTTGNPSARDVPNVIGVVPRKSP
jgi:uncharacterized protein YigE (DUF2233 family)